jgi:hypothetical protein
MFIFSVFVGLFVLLNVATGGDERLDVYRALKGSSVERDILQYARACILHTLGSEQDEPGIPTDLRDLPQVGLYVSLMAGREVRVCVGSMTPRGHSMATAIKDLARTVVYGDIRARPLTMMEMEDLSIVLSFVGPLKEIRNPYAVDFTGEGLYVSQAERGGVLLPGETRTLDYGIRRLHRQHGIDLTRPRRYSSFKVVVFDERSLS